MRIKINETDIIEAYLVIIIPGGWEDEDNKGKYTNMICSFTILYGDGGEYSRFEGRFDCKGATTFEECKAASYKFIDELYKNGCIDISTDEKCEEYGMIFY